jgi:hypothetical protein
MGFASDYYPITFFTWQEYRPAKGNRQKEPLFVIDIFTDGVKLFENSSSASCMPIMGMSNNQKIIKYQLISYIIFLIFR